MILYRAKATGVTHILQVLPSTYRLWHRQHSNRLSLVCTRRCLVSLFGHLKHLPQSGHCFDWCSCDGDVFAFGFFLICFTAFLFRCFRVETFLLLDAAISSSFASLLSSVFGSQSIKIASSMSDCLSYPRCWFISDSVQIPSCFLLCSRSSRLLWNLLEKFSRKMRFFCATKCKENSVVGYKRLMANVTNGQFCRFYFKCNRRW